MRTRVAALLGALACSACASDGRELREPTAVLPAPATSAPIPTTVVAATETVVTSSTPRVSIVELRSPENAIAEASGVGAVPGDAVTVDGEPADLVSFDLAAGGGFVARIHIPDEGAHTVCVADGCGRVYTLDVAAETPEEVIATIEEAIPLAAELVAFDRAFPGWVIEIGGALAGTGGSIDAETKTVTIYRNRGRSVDEFVRTILHEFGHVADVERLDDDGRAEFATLRGFAAGTPWREADAHRLDDWGRQPSEDFAEVLVMYWTDGRWTPRTRPEVGPPTPEQLDAVATLAGFD